MIDVDSYMQSLLKALQNEFQGRLLFLGLQGSYQRGEATESSDLDIVTILGAVELADLDAYHAILQRFPHPEKACGFFCGKEELYAWPKHELFGLLQDTQSFFGDLAVLLPPLSTKDAQEGLYIGASGLYHQACHLYLHGTDTQKSAGLLEMAKAAFFLLRLQYFLETGNYLPTRTALSAALSTREERLLFAHTPQTVSLPSQQASLFSLFIRWTGEVIKKYGV